MTESKTKRFEEICRELRAIDGGYEYERTFRTIARMSQTEEGCTLVQSKSAVAHWWDFSSTLLTDKDVFHTCLSAFPLHALRVAYDKKMKKKK